MSGLPSEWTRSLHGRAHQHMEFGMCEKQWPCVVEQFGAWTMERLVS